MYKLSIRTILVFALLVYAHLPCFSQRIIQDVILINVEPYEVLMTREGKILERLQHLPDYFRDHEATKAEKSPGPAVSTEFATLEVESELAEEIAPELKVTIKEPVILPFSVATGEEKEGLVFEDHYEVFFEHGKATLTNEGIAVLNKLAAHLLAQPKASMIAITFFYEPVSIAQLLSQRRREACIAYLRIRGVDVEEQIVKGGISQSQANKVYFGLRPK